MGAIDWNLVGPAPQFSLSPMIEQLHQAMAMGEARKRYMAEQAAKQASEEELRRHHQELEAYNRGQLDLQGQHQSAVMQREDRAAEDKRRLEAAAAFKDIQTRLQSGDVEGARALTEMHRGQFEPEVKAPAVEPPPAKQPDPLESLMQQAAPLSAEPEQPPVVPRQARITFPGLGPMEVPSREEIQRRSLEIHKAEGEDWRKRMEPQANTAFKTEAMGRVAALMGAGQWDPKEDPGKMWNEINHQLAQAEASKDVARLRAGSYPSQALREAGAVRMDANSMRAEFQKYNQEAGLDRIRQSGVALRDAQHAVSSGNPLLSTESKITLARMFRQAMPTEGEMHLLYSDLGGRLRNLVPGLVAKLESGGLSSVELPIVKQAVGMLREAQEQKTQGWYQGAAQRFGPGSGWENYGGNADAHIQSVAKTLGASFAPIYPGQKAVKIGTGITAATPASKPGESVDARMKRIFGE